MGVTPATAKLLVTFLDVQKIKGSVGGEAAEAYGDYLGFLGLPYNEAQKQYVSDRWNDPRVWIDITPDLEKFLVSDTPLFTPHRLEPVYQAQPFYRQGITAVAPGTYGNPEDGSSVRKAPRLTETYSHFLVNAYLPEKFYMELLNSAVEDALSKGLSKTLHSSPYRLYASRDEAEDSLHKELLGRTATQLPHITFDDYTVLAIDTSFMDLDLAVFFPRKLSGHRFSSRGFCHYYLGSVAKEGISIPSPTVP